MKKYFLETYGCQMNKAESDSLELILQKRGWEPCTLDSQADLIIINTCSVRQTAEDRIWGRIGYFKKLKQSHSFKLVIIGCMAQRVKEELYTTCKGTVDLVLGTLEKNNILEYLEGLPESGSEPGAYTFQEYHSDGTSFKTFVPIMHGCNNFCSYCIVPYVRGREVSRKAEEVLHEIAFLEDHNVREITLLGQNVNSYRGMYQGREISFPELLDLICSHINSIGWVRFLSSHPKDFSSELIDTIASHPQICRHIHLPVQHGSDRILSLMNRRYTASHYLDIVSEIKEKIPGVSLTTDILIGFPGETEEDLEATLDLMNKVRFIDAYTYYYNPREGTKACTMADSLSLDTKLKRLEKVIALQHRITAEEKEKKVGQIKRVLVESVSKKDKTEMLGRTEGDEMVVFPEKYDTIGKFIDVKLLSCNGNTYKGVRV
ncbi:MAG: tRNA (N6-isopentenyl adenosine(37)-C2)-methylthiotransferase MiaB [Spirochaetia bacterium]|nr:tRNA (N6-isopentenyl adenosine(37)-C2)-methylthiotransferase MiaB [Spirochaetia bacterium]